MDWYSDLGEMDLLIWGVQITKGNLYYIYIYLWNPPFFDKLGNFTNPRLILLNLEVTNMCTRSM